MNDGPLRIWNADDYPMLKAWWEGHGFPPVPMQFLPPLGVIFEESAAGFVYMDNGGTGVAMLEWLVTNPQAGIKALKALDHVVFFLCEELRQNGYSAILTTCKQVSLARFLVKRGFERTDEGMIHLMRNL